MRKFVMIVLAAALGVSPAFSAPVNFAVGGLPTAPRAGSAVSAAQPTAQPAPRVAHHQKPSSRFGRFWSSVASMGREPAPAPGTPGAQYPPVNYAAGAQAPPAVDPALSLDTENGPAPAEVLVSFAAVAEQQGNIDAAREHLQKAVGVALNDVKTLRAAGHFEDRQAKLEVAESLYRRAVAADASSTAALNDLAICLARQERLAESADVFRQAIALNPAKPLYRNNIAKVLLELGDQPAAYQQLAAVHSPAAAHYNLGYLLTQKGDNDAAAASYQQALAANAAFGPARDALASLTPAAPAQPVASLPPAPQPVGVPPLVGPGAAPQPRVASPLPPVTPLVTGAPITPTRPAGVAPSPTNTPYGPATVPAVASPYYYPPQQGVRQR